jgi:hypothetical protein
LSALAVPFSDKEDPKGSLSQTLTAAFENGDIFDMEITAEPSVEFNILGKGLPCSNVLLWLSRDLLASWQDLGDGCLMRVLHHYRAKCLYFSDVLLIDVARWKTLPGECLFNKKS